MSEQNTIKERADKFWLLWPRPGILPNGADALREFAQSEVERMRQRLIESVQQIDAGRTKIERREVCQTIRDISIEDKPKWCEHVTAGMDGKTWYCRKALEALNANYYTWQVTDVWTCCPICGAPRP